VGWGAIERMKQTVIQVNTIRLIQIGEPASYWRSLTVPARHSETHPQNTIIDEGNVWVVGDSMFQKGRYVNTRDLLEKAFVEKQTLAEVRAAIVVRKRSNVRGVKGGRKVEMTINP
jgi:hypothetical protein